MERDEGFCQLLSSNFDLTLWRRCTPDCSPPSAAQSGLTLPRPSCKAIAHRPPGAERLCPRCRAMNDVASYDIVAALAFGGHAV